MTGWIGTISTPCARSATARCVLLAWAWPCSSGIDHVDVGSATLKINDDGFYTLSIGAADMGTGCDTILAQIAAEVLELPAGKHCGFGRRYRFFPL